MKRARNGSRRLVAAAAGIQAVGCSLVNHIDVCERARPAVVEVNVRTEGAQQVDGIQCVAPLPSGGALAMFTSATAAEGTGGTAAIRGALLDATGRPQRTCDAPGEFEYVPVVGSDRASRPSLAMPSSSTETVGLLTWWHQPGGMSEGSEIRGMWVTPTGCPRGGGTINMPAPFTISDAPGGLNGDPAVVWVGPRTFVVAWSRAAISGSIARFSVRARVVTWEGNYEPRFLPAVAATDGASQPLVQEGDNQVGVRLVRLRDRRFAALWNEVSPQGVIPHLGVFDDRLQLAYRPQGHGALSTSTSPSDRRLPDGFSLGLAWDGAQLLAAWQQLQPDGTTRLRARLLDEQAHFLSAPQSPRGEAFALGSGAVTSEARPSLSSLPGGGFLAIWEDSDLSTPSGQSVRRLRALALGPGGGPRFVNLTCDATNFDAVLSSVGSVAQPATAALRSGAVTVLWTASGSSTDRSGTGVRATTFQPRDLLPLE